MIDSRRRPAMAALWTGTLLLAGILLEGEPARADELPPVLVVTRAVEEVPAERRRETRRAVEAIAAEHGHRLLDPLVPILEPRPEGALHVAELTQLERADRAIRAAREAATQLREGQAFILLARAERSLEGALAAPGASLFAAELAITTAIVAHQAGIPELAEQSLRRAANLDPSRQLGAGEAPPTLVERSRELSRELAIGPRGRVPIVTTPPGARVFVDDRALGRSPTTVDLPVGEHLLRVLAPGYAPHASFFRVLPGDRPPVALRLTPTRSTVALREAGRAARRGELGRASAALRQGLGSDVHVELWVVGVARDGQRRTLVRCTAEGCGAIVRVETEALLAGRLTPVEPDEPPGRRALDAADRWLSAPPSMGEEPRSRFRRSWPWIALGAAVVGGIVAGVVVGTRPPTREALETTVDFGELTRAATWP